MLTAVVSLQSLVSIIVPGSQPTMWLWAVTENTTSRTWQGSANRQFSTWPLSCAGPLTRRLQYLRCLSGVALEAPGPGRAGLHSVGRGCKRQKAEASPDQCHCAAQLHFLLAGATEQPEKQEEAMSWDRRAAPTHRAKWRGASNSSVMEARQDIATATDTVLEALLWS